MAFRNPNEGMAKFLGSIGDMRRMWEQEEQVRQQQARAAEAHKQNLEKGALDMTLAKSDEARRVAEETHKGLLRPGEVKIQTQNIDLGGKRLQEADIQLSKLKQEYDLAVRYGDKQKAAELESQYAQIAASRASAANSTTQNRRNQLALGQETRAAETLKSLWDTPASSDPGAPTIGTAQALGGIEHTPWGADYTRNAQEYNRLIQMAAWGGATEAQLSAVNALGAKLGRPPITMDQLIGINKRSGGNSVLDRLNQTQPGGKSAGAGTGLTEQELVEWMRQNGG